MESEELRYFQALEKAFIRLRGAPLLLAPADWQVAQRWRELGIPLDVVITSLEELFLRRHEHGQEGRVSSLRYCRPAVEREWRRVTELRGPAERASGDSFDVPRRLRALAASLPSGWQKSEALAASILSLDKKRLETAENLLMKLDAGMLEVAAADLTGEQANAFEERIRTRLEALARDFSPGEVGAAEGRLRCQELRRQFALPVLSLFAPEVESALEGE